MPLRSIVKSTGHAIGRCHCVHGKPHCSNIYNILLTNVSTSIDGSRKNLIRVVHAGSIRGHGSRGQNHPVTYFTQGKAVSPLRYGALALRCHLPTSSDVGSIITRLRRLACCDLHVLCSGYEEHS
jgi:hypothetical protein